MSSIEDEVSWAVEYYWSKLSDQAAEQQEGEDAARGRRAEVLGGRQLDGFATVCEEILMDAGVPEESIYFDHKATLPGYFRATKRWDLAVIHEGELLAAIEFKSITSSFGNNLNNRTEEALGSPTDLYTAYEEGAYETSPRPWLGYLMLMAENDASTGSVRVSEPHFNVLEDFDGASYVDRGEQLCLRLLRRRLYDGCAFLLSDAERGVDGEYWEPQDELTFRRFAGSLVGHIKSYLEFQGTTQERL